MMAQVLWQAPESPVGTFSTCTSVFLWLISTAGLGFRFELGHRFLYYADTMGKGSESESESVEICSA